MSGCPTQRIPAVKPLREDQDQDQATPSPKALRRHAPAGCSVRSVDDGQPGGRAISGTGGHVVSAEDRTACHPEPPHAASAKRPRKASSIVPKHDNHVTTTRQPIESAAPKLSQGRCLRALTSGSCWRDVGPTHTRAPTSTSAPISTSASRSTGGWRKRGPRPTEDHSHNHSHRTHGQISAFLENCP